MTQKHPTELILLREDKTKIDLSKPFYLNEVTYFFIPDKPALQQLRVFFEKTGNHSAVRDMPNDIGLWLQDEIMGLIYPVNAKLSLLYKQAYDLNEEAEELCILRTHLWEGYFTNK